MPEVRASDTDLALMTGAVQTLISRMALALDEERIDVVEACLHPDFRLNVRGSETERGAFVDSLHSRKGEGTYYCHLLGPTVLRACEDEVVHCGTNFIAFAGDRDQLVATPLSPTVVGCYDDELRRLSGRWLIFRRDIKIRFQGVSR